VIFFADGEAEVSDVVRSGSFFDKDVGGLDVAVDQVTQVGMIQRFGGGSEQLGDFID